MTAVSAESPVSLLVPMRIRKSLPRAFRDVKLTRCPFYPESRGFVVRKIPEGVTPAVSARRELRSLEWTTDLRQSMLAVRRYFAPVLNVVSRGRSTGQGLARRPRAPRHVKRRWPSRHRMHAIANGVAHVAAFLRWKLPAHPECQNARPSRPGRSPSTT